jgi:hypothetical protein
MNARGLQFWDHFRGCRGGRLPPCSHVASRPIKSALQSTIQRLFLRRSPPRRRIPPRWRRGHDWSPSIRIFSDLVGGKMKKTGDMTGRLGPRASRSILLAQKTISSLSPTPLAPFHFLWIALIFKAAPEKFATAWLKLNCFRSDCWNTETHREGWRQHGSALLQGNLCELYIGASEASGNALSI